MPRFILLDQSLKKAGGHHFDYALQVLRAAAELGCAPVLISHKRFRGHASLPRDCLVLPMFRHDTYNEYSIFFGTRHRFASTSGAGPRGGSQPVLARWRALLRRTRYGLYELRYRNGPQRRVREFSDDCRTAFDRLGLQAGDVVFLPTVSELDLEGLARFLQSEPASREVDWHVQFHFSIFHGREPDYPQQAEKFAWLRQHLTDTLARIGGHRLHFHNTTDVLARQYNRLGIARFDPLPYPIDEVFHTQRIQQRDTSRPLRITCAGGVRPEKGLKGLEDLARQLWSHCLDQGSAQLVVQVKRGRLTGRPRHPIPLPRATRDSQRTHLPQEECRDPVVYIRHPLGTDDYTELVRRADIGLFLYDSVLYYSRRAGVLGEMLAAGVPVVVPAGCWLAEQVAEPNYRHAAGLVAQLPCVGIWQPPASGGQGFDDAGMPCRPGDVLVVPGEAGISYRLPVPENVSELAVAFDWVLPDDHGTYLRLDLEQFDGAGALLGRSGSILGHLATRSHQVTLLRAQADTRALRLTLSNAYDKGDLSICELELRFLSSDHLPERTSPLGAVGLVAADPGETPRLLREMIRHYAHYRRSAGAYSVEFFQRHDPRLTVQTLLDTSRRQPPHRQAT
jgi:hypothetical protein